MNEPRKPIFGFLWPRPDPDAPVDGAYRQVRPVRISPRGPIRIAALALGAGLEAMIMGAAVMAALTSALSPATLIGAAAAASGMFLLLRGSVVGTLVTDRHLLIETTFRRTSLPWAEVRALEARQQSGPFLGLPARIRCLRVVAVDAAGRSHGTHVYATSPDYWLRAEAFDMAVLRLERWRQDTDAS